MLSLSVTRETGQAFDPARLHVVHGMSKDFGSNGLRLGVLITQNNPLLLRTLAQVRLSFLLHQGNKRHNADSEVTTIRPRC